MLLFIFILLILAMGLGLYLLSFILAEKNTPKGIAFIHGPVAVFALLCLIVYALGHRPSPILSLIVLIFAALGGGILIFRDLTGKSIPSWMAIGHGVAAVLGFILLVVYSLNL